MKRLLPLSSICLLLVAFAIPANAQDKKRNLSIVATEGPLKGQKIYNNSHALLIGVNKYPGLPPDRQLDYAIADVDAVKNILIGSYGFEENRVTVLKDGQATKAEILRALNELTDNTTVAREDRIIIYFSGHGQTVTLPTGGEIGFIIPNDGKVNLANVTNARPYNETCIKMEEIWGILRLAPAKHVLFIADSCYSGLAVKNRSIAISPAALAALTKEPALHAMSAGKRNQVSVEMPDKGHGAFTFALLQALRIRAGQPGVPFTVNDLFSDVQTTVANVTEGKQTPQFGNYDTEGVFVFVPTGEPVSPVPTIPDPTPKPKPGAKPNVQAVDSVARIQVTSNPPGAKIFLDGKSIPGKTTPATIDLDLEIEQSREVEIAVKLDGFKVAVRKATLVRGKNPDLSIKLDKAIVQPVGELPEPSAGPSAPPAAGGIQPAAGSLARHWKLGAAIRAKTNIIMQVVMGGQIVTEETFKLTISNVDPDGTATLTQHSEGISMTIAGQSTSAPGGEPNSEAVTRLGNLVDPKGEDNPLFDAATQKLISVVTEAFMPGDARKVGDTWETSIRNPATDKGKLTLTGRLIGTENVLGVAAWKIKQTGKVNTDPDDCGDNKMGVDITFWIYPSTGMVLKADGQLTAVPGEVGVMNWTLKMQALQILK